MENKHALRFAHESLIAYSIAQWPGYQAAEHHHLIARTLERVERGDLLRVILTVPPRHGKPVDVESLILMGDGSRKKLRDVEVGDSVITHRGRPQRVIAVHEQGFLSSVRIKTALGRTAVAALDHPFMTTRGWVLAGDLTTADTLALVYEPATESSSPRSIAEFALAGYFVGDGNTSPNQGGRSCAANITSADPLNIADFTELAQQMGWSCKKSPSSKYRYDFSGGVRDWLKAGELVGTSYTKRVPSWVFHGSREQISAFIGAYFSCDGSVSKRGAARKDCACEFYSVSRALLEDVQHLLLRIGVRSRITVKNGRTQDGRHHLSWRLAITSLDDVAAFYENVRLRSEKALRLKQWNPVKVSFRSEFFADKVVAIEDAGDVECRCLTVDTDHTFTVSDIVVHNSMLASENFPAWYLGRNPDKYIAACTYAQGFANRFGRKVRNQLRGQLHKAVFPGCRLSDDSQSNKDFATAEGGEYHAVGRGGALTGMGAHLLLIDDPLKNRQEADSATIRRQMREWYESTAYTRLMPGGAIVVIQTRWHEDDLAGWLLREHAHEGWTVINLPALAESDDLLGRAEGEALWPSAYPREALLKIQQSVGSREWSSLYQQRPTVAAGKIFLREYWRYYSGVLPHILHTIQSWDTAFKTGEDNDYSVCTTWGVTERGFYLLDRFKDKLAFPELKRAVQQQASKHNVLEVLIEDKASGQSLVQELQRDTLLSIIPVPVDRDKEARAWAVTPIIEAGRVYLPEDAPWVADLVDEMAAFPAGTHDDQVDSVTQALARLAARYTHVGAYSYTPVRPGDARDPGDDDDFNDHGAAGSGTW